MANCDALSSISSGLAEALGEASFSPLRRASSHKPDLCTGLLSCIAELVLSVGPLNNRLLHFSRLAASGELGLVISIAGTAEFEACTSGEAVKVASYTGDSVIGSFLVRSKDGEAGEAISCSCDSEAGPALVRVKTDVAVYLVAALCSCDSEAEPAIVRVKGDVLGAAASCSCDSAAENSGVGDPAMCSAAPVLALVGFNGISLHSELILEVFAMVTGASASHSDGSDSGMVLSLTFELMLEDFDMAAAAVIRSTFLACSSLLVDVWPFAKVTARRSLGCLAA